MSATLPSNQSLCRLSILPRVDCEENIRAEKRACNSIVWYEVQFDVVVVDVWDKDWEMALRSSSLVSWLWLHAYAVYAFASVSGQVVRQLGVMLNGLGDHQRSTPPHAWLEKFALHSTHGT